MLFLTTSQFVTLQNQASFLQDMALFCTNASQGHRVLRNGAPFPYLPNARARISHDSSAATITIKVAKNQDLKTLLRPSFRVMEQQQKFSVTSASNEMQFHLFSQRLLVD